MDHPIRRPEEILAYRPLRRVLEAKPKAVWTGGPADSTLAVLQMMADKNIGFVVVMEGSKLAGVVSERDCARKVVLAKKTPESTPVADIMTRNVVTVDLDQTFADCLRLMHQHGIRHLPVTDKGNVTAVVSIRDLLGEAVAHHAKMIAELGGERLTIVLLSAQNRPAWA